MHFLALAVLLATGFSTPVRPSPAPGVTRAAYSYLSPIPGSRRVTRTTGIIIRAGAAIDRAALSEARIRAIGSLSGLHAGAPVLSDDDRTLVFKPDLPFSWGESVRVEFDAGLRSHDGTELPPLAFDFTIADGDPVPMPASRFADEIPASSGAASAPSRAARAPQVLDDSLPLGYPPITVMTSDHPDPGALFMSPFTSQNAPGRLLILDHRGFPLYYRAWPHFVFDFKRQPNGLITFFSDPGTFYVMDSTCAVVDSFQMGNGYTADEHDFQMLPNGHVLMMAYDPEPVRMDSVVAGGHPDALVIGLVLQELDEARNVVFQWRSWDHFQITDLVECSSHLTDLIVDWVHGNAIEPDLDGNILISSRHLNEITKIDRETGDVIWRLGLNSKNNQFTFLDDDRGFAHQHDIRRQPNGHITLFDNGNCLDPLFSRAVEYELDEVNKTARRVWEFRNTPDIFGPFMGDQQRHADGGITIGWGGTAFDPKVTELHADGSKAFEIGFGSPVIWTYRAFRFPWQTAAFTVGSGTLDFGAVEAGEIASQTLWITNPLGTPLALNQFPVTGAAFSVVDPGPIVIAPGDSAALSVQFAPDTLRDYAGELYVRSVDDLVLIAQPVALHGTGTGRSLSIDDVTGREGDDGVTPFFHFTLRLDAPATTAVTVQYATEDSTATAGDGDYLPVSGSATIAVGDSTADVAVIVIGDAIVEPDEIFHLRLLGATHAVIARPWARGKILGDDGDLAVEGPEGQGPAFALYPVLPNPARDEVALRFDLPAASRVSLEIYDVRGRHVATLVDGLVPAGHQSAVWRSGPRPGGVYFARLKAGSREISRKLVIVR